MPESTSGRSFLSRMSGSRSTLSKDYKATVQLLDDNETITVDFKKNDTGKVIFDYVCEWLNIVEKDYFGLRFMDNYKNRYWLDPAKPVLRQVKGSGAGGGLVLRWRVKYYPADPNTLREELTRYQLFLQLRRDLLHGRLYAPQSDAALLGAYIVQSEVGSYSAEEQPDGYVSEYKLFLKQTEKLEDRIAGHHAQLGDLTPAQSELAFLRKAANLDTYGYDPYTVKDAKGNQLYLGVTHQGILVYQSNRKIHHIKWDELEKVDYIGKEFLIVPKASYTAGLNANAVANANANSPSKERPSGDEDEDENKDEEKDQTNEATPNGLLEDDKEKKTGVLRLTCPSGSFSKHLWKYTLSQEAFFTSRSRSEVREVASRARIPIIARGSRFRYTGRVLAEIAEEPLPEGRAAPAFVRYHVERQPSRLDRSFPWSSKYATLPRSRPKPEPLESEANRSLEAPPALTDQGRYTDTRAESPIDDIRESISAASPVFDTPATATGAPPRNKEAQPAAFANDLASPNYSTPLQDGKAQKAYDKGKNNDVFKDVKTSNGPTSEAKPDSGTPQSGLCARIANKILSLLLITMLLTGVVAVIMEVTNSNADWRRYTHRVPGIEAFRYRAYDPARVFTMRMYHRFLGDL